jgi:hypothetical protein
MELDKLFKDLKKQFEDDESSSLKTAIFWGREDILGGAVEALLKSLKKWKVMRIFHEKDTAVMTHKVESIKPDLLVVNQNEISGEIHSLVRLIRDCPELKIIAVNPVNNVIEVYDKHSMQIGKVSDLLSVIEEHPRPVLEGGEDQNAKTTGAENFQPHELER